MKLSARKQKIVDDLAKIADKQHVKKDDSARFTLVGGPYHGNTVRLYPPWEILRYKDPEVFYELHPPIDRGDNWVYIHTEAPTT